MKFSGSHHLYGVLIVMSDTASLARGDCVKNYWHCSGHKSSSACWGADGCDWAATCNTYSTGTVCSDYCRDRPWADDCWKHESASACANFGYCYWKDAGSSSKGGGAGGAGGVVGVIIVLLLGVAGTIFVAVHCCLRKKRTTSAAPLAAHGEEDTNESATELEVSSGPDGTRTFSRAPSTPDVPTRSGAPVDVETGKLKLSEKIIIQEVVGPDGKKKTIKRTERPDGTVVIDETIFHM